MIVASSFSPASCYVLASHITSGTLAALLPAFALLFPYGAVIVHEEKTIPFGLLIPISNRAVLSKMSAGI